MVDTYGQYTGGGDTPSSSPAYQPTGKYLGVAGGLMQGFGSVMTNLAYAKDYAKARDAAYKAAEEAPKVAQWQIARLRIQKRTLLSSQRFAAAMAGITMEGTPTDIQLNTEREIELDAAGIYREGQLEREAYLQQGYAYDRAKHQAEGSAIMGAMGIAGSLFSAWEKG